MNRPLITVLGSANMDLVALVDTAPGRGETVTGTGFLQVPGGKGANQAVAAARAGGRVAFAGAVGDDPFGSELRDLYLREGIDVEALEVRPSERTGTAHILVEATGENSIVVIPGANGSVRVDERVAAMLAGSVVVLLQLEVPLSVVTEAAVGAHAAGAKVVLTPAPVVDLPDELLAATDLVVPNGPEAARLTSGSDPDEAATLLLERGVGGAVITLGADGCLYAGSDGSTHRVPGRRVQAVDTTGAGDVFAGNLAVALAEDRPMLEALQRATIAGALSVQERGASDSAPTRQQVETALRQ